MAAIDTAITENPTQDQPPSADPNTLGGRLALGLQGFREMPVGRQIALISMLAGGLVAVVAILFWALRPTYVPLFSQLEATEAAKIMEALTGLGVPYRVDNILDASRSRSSAWPRHAYCSPGRACRNRPTSVSSSSSMNLVSAPTV
jgi:Flagellar biosynthesis/type III secretory pathway lipoprotein